MSTYNPLPNNPYTPKDALIVSGLEASSSVDFQKMLASFEWSIDNSGLMEIDPVTGFEHGDLDFYTVQVSDGAVDVCGQLDLATRDVFTVPTTSLNQTNPWHVKFFAGRGGDYLNDSYTLDYEFTIKDPAAIAAAGGGGTTIPTVDIWSNIEWTIKLDSSTDPAFTEFPEDGILVKRGDVLDFDKYSTDNELLEGEDYIFKVYAQRKPQLDAGFSSENLSGDVNATPPSFPFSIGVKQTQLYADFSLDAATAGTKSALLQYEVYNGGVLSLTNFSIGFTVV